MALKYVLPEHAEWDGIHSYRPDPDEDVNAITKHRDRVLFYDRLFFRIHRFRHGRIYKESLIPADYDHPEEDYCTSLAARFSYAAGKMAAIVSDPKSNHYFVEMITSSGRGETTKCFYFADKDESVRYVKCSSKLLVAVTRRNTLYIWDHTRQMRIGCFESPLSRLSCFEVSDISVVAVDTARGQLENITRTWTVDPSTSSVHRSEFQFNPFSDFSPAQTPQSSRESTPEEDPEMDEEILLEGNSRSIVYFFRIHDSVHFKRYDFSGRLLAEKIFSDRRLCNKEGFHYNSVLQRQPRNRCIVWSFTVKNTLVFVSFHSKLFQLSLLTYDLPHRPMTVTGVRVRGDVAYIAHDLDDDPDNSELLAVRLDSRGRCHSMGVQQLLAPAPSLVLGDENMLFHVSRSAFIISRFVPA